MSKPVPGFEGGVFPHPDDSIPVLLSPGKSWQCKTGRCLMPARCGCASECLIPDPETLGAILDEAFTRYATDTSYKAPAFIETYTGRAFWPLEPKVEDVSIIDIAHHLSNQCRYSGATESFYCTAQHCCLLENYAAKKNASVLDRLQILTHDAPETYLVDIPRPVKQFMPEYRKWDHQINVVVRSWLGLDGVPIPSWQDEYDSRIVVDEHEQALSNSLDWGHDARNPLGIAISPWSPKVSEQQFLMRYADLMLKLTGRHQYLRSGWGVPTHAMFKEFPFKSESSDMPEGPTDERVITDLMEVDIRGNVGRVRLRSPNGMLIRDTRAGSYPRPAWKFIHGKFELLTPASNSPLLEGGA